MAEQGGERAGRRERASGSSSSAAERAARDAGAERERALSAQRARQEGVVHTPLELARFMARAADSLLRQELGLVHGLADPALAVLDPACGPGAFLAAVGAVVGERARRANAAPVPSLLHAWDRDPSAIAQVRARVAPLLAAGGLDCELSAADTLVELEPTRVAALRPNLCLLGNPPWIGSAQPRPAPWLDRLLEDFRRDDHGERLAERKLGVLADAYVRFLCWAAASARLAQRGALVAFVTNGSYLDGPVHRGMRGALLRVFDRIWVLDAGGSALLARGSGQDENLFGVRPSVAIVFALRTAGRSGTRAPDVRYSRLLGSRRAKLERLAGAELLDLAWQRLSPTAPRHRFVPGPSAGAEYERWLSLDEAMPFHREGVQTNRDAMVIDQDRSRLIARLRAFARNDVSSPALILASRTLPHYAPERARAVVADALLRDADGSRGQLVRPLAYRPFDLRWFAPLAPLCHRPRPDLLRAMDHSQLALVTVRKDRGHVPYAHVFAARLAIDNCLLSSRSSCRARAFPTHDPGGAPNLAATVVRRYGDRVGRVITSLEFVRYALAALANPEYRRRHEHALQIDYPRIPDPRDASDFDAGVMAGEALIELMTQPLLPATGAPTPTPQQLSSSLSVGHHRPLEQFARAAQAPDLLAALHERCQRIEALLSRLANP